MNSAAAHLEPVGARTAARPGPLPALVQLRDVGKTFHPWARDPVRALDGVAFDVPAGAVTALIGPSGCGKSTLLRMVAGLERPDTGLLQIDGRPITGPGRDRGMVFQSYTSFPWLTVRGNVEYGLRLAGVPSARRRDIAARMIEMVQLERFAEAWPPCGRACQRDRHGQAGAQTSRAPLEGAGADLPVVGERLVVGGHEAFHLLHAVILQGLDPQVPVEQQPGGGFVGVRDDHRRFDDPDLGDGGDDLPVLSARLMSARSLRWQT